MTQPRWGEMYTVAAMRAVSFAGDIAAATAIVLYLQSNGYAAGFIVATLVATAAPPVLLAPFTGRISDRYDSRTVMLATAAVQAVICLAMAIWLDRFVIVGLTAVLSAGIALTHPIFGALPRSIVGVENVARAAAISQTAAMAGMLTAPAIGGFLAGSFGTRWALLLDAASFVAVAAGALVVKTRLHVPGGGAKNGDADEGYSVWRDPFLRRLLGSMGLVVTCVSMNSVVSVFLVRETLSASKQAFGLVETAWMAGLIVGSILAGRKKMLSSSAQVLFAFFCMGIALTLSAFVPSVWWLIPVNVLGGIGNGAMATNLHVILNVRTPENHRGRAFAALGAVSNAAPLTGYLLGGLLISAASPRISYLVIGLAACVCSTVVAPSMLGRTRGALRDRTVEYAGGATP